jgi:GntR family transcriptional regulator/MocR family aminotransferase
VPFHADPSLPEPLYRQIYEGVRQAIVHGTLASSARLPSTRALAEQLAVSRSTVVLAYELLLSEGYLQSGIGSGTTVAATVPPEAPSNRRAEHVPPAAPQSRPRLSRRGAALAATSVTAIHAPAALRAFRPGLPDFDLFPFATWARLAARHWHAVPREALGYSDPGGYGPLRREIADYLRSSRRVICEPAQVIVVAGTQQALDLTARLLLDPGDSVWIEDPGYLGARSALRGAGARLVPVPVDAEGLDINAAIVGCPAARLAYVTPAYQFPLGVTMSLARRLALLRWAAETGAWIVEDDYDSEYRYVGRPLSALQGIDTAGQVIYIGTFSKVLFPGLRLGYIVVPPALVEAFLAARAATDRHSPLLDQVILADFMQQGHFAQHIRRTRALYAERQAILLEAASAELKGAIDVRPAPAGMHLLATLADVRVEDLALSREAQRHGVVAPPLRAYSMRSPQQQALLLGYTTVDAEVIRAGVRALAQALDAAQGQAALATK